jgi:hypothetical protein
VSAFLLTTESADWLRRKRAEGDSPPGPLRPAVGPSARAAMVRCGDLADPLLGLYSAMIVERPLASAPWETPGTSAVRLGELNGGTLTPGRYYLAFAAGFDSQPSATRNPVYWAAETCCAGGTGWPGSGGTGGSGSGSGSGAEDYLWANCCGGSLPIPGAFYLNLVNKTGLFACLPNSIEFLAADGFDVGMTQRQHNTPFDGSGCTPAGTFTASVNWTCGGGGTTYSVIVSVSPPAGFGTWQGFVTTTGETGWNGGTGFTGFGLSSVSRACGADPFAEEELLGSAALDFGSGVVGTMDLVLSR